MSNEKAVECLKEIEKHQHNLIDYLGLDNETNRKEIIHLNHRFFKTFFPLEEDNFVDELSFNSHTNFDCWKLLGTSLVEL